MISLCVLMMAPVFWTDEGNMVGKCKYQLPLVTPCMQRKGVKRLAIVSVGMCTKVKSEWHFKANLVEDSSLTS